MLHLLGQAEPQQAEQFDEQFVGLLFFGGAVLVVFAAIYLWQNSPPRGGDSEGKKGAKTSRISVTFARLYGLLTVAILAVALAFAEVGSDAKTAAFTLLGTIAGYLAGSKPTDVTTTTTTQTGSDSNGGQPGSPDKTTTVAESVL